MKPNESVFEMQKGEITEHLIYSELAKRTKDAKNRKILEQIAEDELKHYGILSKITKCDAAPDRFRVWRYVSLSSIFGLSFGLKLMEGGEGNAQSAYEKLKKTDPAIAGIIKDEERHEKELLDIISEERLDYASSIVLGLNDAIVEFTGTLAGLTFALADGKIIGITGLIMGIAASLSMGASSYLSAKEDRKKDPAKSFAYTGVAYFLTVLLLVAPYFLLANVYFALALLLAFTFAIIAGYSFYITTAKGKEFWPQFMEMAGLSFGVAVISFIAGTVLRMYFGS